MEFTWLVENVVVEEFDEFLDFVGDGYEGVLNRYILSWFSSCLGDDNVDAKEMHAIP